MDDLSKLILTDKATRKQFISNFYAGGTDGQISDSKLDETGI